jgi:protein involved in polysaccharide export with SLBB domain
MKLIKSSRVWAAVSVFLLAGVLFSGCRTARKDQVFADLPGTPQPAAPAAADGTAAPAAPDWAVAAPSRAAPAGGTNNPGNPELLKVADDLLITFSDLTTLLPPFDVIIRQDGTITLMYNKTFLAAGKTTRQLADEIRAAYVPDYFKNMTATVAIKEQTRFYYVGGEVKLPGRQIYIGQITLLKAIQTAGDFTDFAQKHKVQLTRADGKTIIHVDCMKARKDPSLDPQVYPGDNIWVPRRRI